VALADGWRADESGILGATVRALYDLYRPNLSPFRLTYMHLQISPSAREGIDPEFVKRINPESWRMFDALERVLARGVGAGTVRADLDPRKGVVGAHASAIGLLTMLALAEASGDPLRHRDEALLGSLSDILHLGVRPR
jgi:hypothetical protein